MRYPSTVQVSKIERSIERPGFTERYHRVTFDLSSEGIPSNTLAVWVHPAFPDDRLERVARTFAWSRLVALSQAAREGCYSPSEIQMLWREVCPDNFSARS